MIFLREPGVLFLKPHKVAGSSFEIALSKFAQTDDIVTPLNANNRADEVLRRELGFPGPRNYRYPFYRLPFLAKREWQIARRQRQWPSRFRSHSPAAEVQERLAAPDWDNAIKVSIVRNPYETAVSTYFWSRKKGESFAQFWQANPHLVARNQRYYCANDKVIIDHFIRLENAAEDIATLEATKPSLAGLGETFASISAKSGSRPSDASAASMFAEAPEVRHLIERDCAFEIERFGYTLTS